MNSKKAKQLKKEARQFALYTGLNTDQVYKQLKKTSKGVSIKQNKSA